MRRRGEEPRQNDDLVGHVLSIEQKAKELAVDSPCESDQQCGILVLNPVSIYCQSPYYHAYSLISDTARIAEIMAAEQRSAADAIVASTSDSVVCPASILPQPIPFCLSGQCVVQ